MFSVEILELSRRRKDVLDGANALLVKANKEGRDLTGHEAAEFDRRHAEGAEMRKRIDRMQLQDAEDEALRSAMADGRTAGEGPVGSPGAAPTQPADQEMEDFRSYVRVGIGGMQEEQRRRVTARMTGIPVEARNFLSQRALSDLTGAQGGFTVPQGFEKDLVTATLAFGDFLQEIDEIPTDLGNQLPWPSANDTGQRATVVAYWAGQAVALSVQISRNGPAQINNTRQSQRRANSLNAGKPQPGPKN